MINEARMLHKPFKPPLLKQQLDTNDAERVTSQDGPRAKKRRISTDSLDTITTPKASTSVPELPVTKPRKEPWKPLQVVKNPVAVNTGFASANDGVEGYYTVLWRKFTTKKNKTWDGDGVLSISGGYATLQDISGKEMGKTACKSPLLPGSTLSVGGKDVEVESITSRESFMAGRLFLGSVKKPAFQLPKEAGQSTALNVQVKQRKIEAAQVNSLIRPAPLSKATRTAFKNPLLVSNVLPKVANSAKPIPRHDPNAEGSLVMKRPNSVPKGKQIVDVVVDPILSKSLREHQRAGVSFLYERVMGLSPYGGEGAILADAMGLGKTLQTIALLWTLLKQNPVYEEQPVIKKALIVCPATLTNNWRKEFRKWLGSERIGVFVVENDMRARLTDFTMGKAYSIMIIGYEKLRTVQDDLKKGNGIDIVICDEGHRLKTATNKSALAIKSLNTERRVILSGTPLQNNLSEFYMMVDLVNPGVLNKYSTFKREFETPILKSRQPDATAKDIEKGEARSKELTSITDKFILRRTADVLSKYLPPKTEYVLFCRPTEAQASVYRSVISSPVFNAILGSPEAALQLINVLKKVCNSPSLLMKRGEESSNETIANLLSGVPRSLLSSPGASGKLQVLDSLLHTLRTTTDEKIVLVSNYTSTLDILANLLDSLSYTHLRLDGTTQVKKRQELVDRFNRTSAANCFAFLLSAKAGGAGLNLIGASRLVLFDIDWNPATDLQAMARIHRDGQKKECHIYRMLTKGALDEKIFQRQTTKQGLADSVMDNKGSSSSFTSKELRDLFTLDEREACQTHELLACPCNGQGTGVEDAISIPDDVDNADDEARSDEDLPDIPALMMKANQVNMEEQESRIRQAARLDKKGKNKMLALMQYAHLDTTKLRVKARASSRTGQTGLSLEDDADEIGETSANNGIEDVIEDEVLRSVLREDGNRIAFLFAKSTS
ncbi:helicase [Elasticomyces elasticus]|nr:helicase [Elasticomyces elasticus]